MGIYSKQEYRIKQLQTNINKSSLKDWRLCLLSLWAGMILIHSQWHPQYHTETSTWWVCGVSCLTEK